MAKFRKLAILIASILMVSVLAFAVACQPVEKTPDDSSVVDSSVVDSSVEDSSSTPDETPVTYIITFANDDGTELYSVTVEEGVTPEYTGAVPTKASTAEKDFTFAGWDATIVPASGNVTYTATYTETIRKYAIVLVYDNGAESQTFEVEYGTSAELLYASEMIPSKEGHTFTGWYVQGVKVEESDTVQGEMVIVAGWTANTYTVKFLNADGSVLHEAEMEYGEVIVYTQVPSKEATTDKEYQFSGWDPTFENGVTTVPVDGATFTAQYSESARKYNVTFLNNDESVLAVIPVAYGEVPVYEGTPSYVGLSVFVQSFAGWDSGLVEVTGEATYKATYEIVEGAQLANQAGLDAGVWECMGYNADRTYYICGAGRQFGINANNVLESQSGIGIANAAIMQAKSAGYNYLEIAVTANNWYAVSNKPVYNAWAYTNQAYSHMSKPTGDYIVIDLSNINQVDGYTLLATCSNVVYMHSARFVNTPVTENVDFASILYSYGYNENGNGSSPAGAVTKYVDNNNGKGGMYWAQNSKAGIQQYLGVNLSRQPGEYSADVAFLGTTDVGTGATVYLKDYIGSSGTGNNTVEQAIASGMTKVIVTVYVSNVEASVYYWAQAREWETNITSEGTLATIDENGFATVEIDISNFDASKANYLTLPFLKGNSGDWMAYMSIKFAK